MQGRQGTDGAVALTVPARDFKDVLLPVPEGCSTLAYRIVLEDKGIEFQVLQEQPDEDEAQSHPAGSQKVQFAQRKSVRYSMGGPRKTAPGTDDASQRGSIFCPPPRRMRKSWTRRRSTRSSTR